MPSSSAPTDAISEAGFFTQDGVDRDPELFASLADELQRQRNQVELIASENIESALQDFD